MEKKATKIIDITSLSGYAIDVDSDVQTVLLKGSLTLSSDFLITASSTPTEGFAVNVICTATIILNGNDVKVFGTTIPPGCASGTVYTPRWGAISVYTDSTWYVLPVAYPQPAGGVTVDLDADGGLIVKASSIEAAQIGSTLTATLAALTTKTYVDAQDAAEAVLRTAGDAAAWSGISGDITVTAGGVSAIGADKVVAAMIKDGDIADTHIAAGAAIALTKLAASTASVIPKFGTGGQLEPTTTTPTELGYLAGVTPGTVTSNKVLVVGASKTIDELDVTTLKTGGVTVVPTGNTVTRTEISADVVLTAATIRSYTRINVGAGAVNVTLPLANTIAAGTRWEFVQVAAAGAAKVLVQGSDGIDATSGSEVTDITLGGAGNRLILVCDGTSQWVVY